MYVYVVICSESACAVIVQASGLEMAVSDGERAIAREKQCV